MSNMAWKLLAFERSAVIENAYLRFGWTLEPEYLIAYLF